MFSAPEVIERSPVELRTTLPVVNVPPETEIDDGDTV
jgi:hypothetical protein